MQPSNITQSSGGRFHATFTNPDGTFQVHTLTAAQLAAVDPEAVEVLQSYSQALCSGTAIKAGRLPSAPVKVPSSGRPIVLPSDDDEGPWELPNRKRTAMPTPRAQRTTTKPTASSMDGGMYGGMLGVMGGAAIQSDGSVVFNGDHMSMEVFRMLYGTIDDSYPPLPTGPPVGLGGYTQKIQKTQVKANVSVRSKRGRGVAKNYAEIVDSDEEVSGPQMKRKLDSSDDDDDEEEVVPKKVKPAKKSLKIATARAVKKDDVMDLGSSLTPLPEDTAGTDLARRVDFGDEPGPKKINPAAKKPEQGLKPKMEPQQIGSSSEDGFESFTETVDGIWPVIWRRRQSARLYPSVTSQDLFDFGKFLYDNAAANTRISLIDRNRKLVEFWKQRGKNDAVEAVKDHRSLLHHEFPSVPKDLGLYTYKPIIVAALVRYQHASGMRREKMPPQAQYLGQDYDQLSKIAFRVIIESGQVPRDVGQWQEMINKASPGILRDYDLEKLAKGGSRENGSLALTLFDLSRARPASELEIDDRLKILSGGLFTFTPANGTSGATGDWLMHLALSSLITDRSLSLSSAYPRTESGRTWARSFIHDLVDQKPSPDHYVYPRSGNLIAIDYQNTSDAQKQAVRAIILEQQQRRCFEWHALQTLILAKTGVFFGRSQKNCPDVFRGLVNEILGSEQLEQMRKAPLEEKARALLEAQHALDESPYLEDSRLQYSLCLMPAFEAQVDTETWWPWDVQLYHLIREAEKALGMPIVSITKLGNERGCYFPGCNCHRDDQQTGAVNNAQARLRRLDLEIMLPSAIDVRLGRFGPKFDGTSCQCRFVCPAHARAEAYDLDAIGISPAVLDSMRRAEKVLRFRGRPSNHTDQDAHRWMRARGENYPLLTCTNAGCPRRLVFPEVDVILGVDKRTGSTSAHSDYIGAGAGLDPTCQDWILCELCWGRRAEIWKRSVEAEGVTKFKLAPPLVGPTMACCAMKDDGSQCEGRAPIGPPLDSPSPKTLGAQYGFVMPPDEYFQEKQIPLPYDPVRHPRAAERFICIRHFQRYCESPDYPTYITWRSRVRASLAPMESFRALLVDAADDQPSVLQTVRVPLRVLERIGLWHKINNVWAGGSYGEGLAIMVQTLTTAARRQENDSVRQSINKLRAFLTHGMKDSSPLED